MKITNNLGRYIAASFAFSLSAMFAWGQSDATFAHDSTMNALDYMLQRPLPNEHFAHKSFADRLFLSIEAGPDWMRTSKSLIGVSPTTPGFRAGITIGDWVTPVHGWRVSLGGGQHHGALGLKPTFGYISADYLMNFSALLRGDNPSRRFELIGSLGIEAEALHRDGHKLWGAAGVRLGLQPRVYLNNSTYLYLEPRIGVFNDGLDDVSTWHNYDWNATVMLGLGYRLNSGRGYRVNNSLWISDGFRDNIFIGVSGGANVLGPLNENLSKRIAPIGGAFIGKWFSPSSALRLSAYALQIKQFNHLHRWAGIVDLDYMWNLNSTMNGYDPDRAIEANIILGISGAYTGSTGSRIFPGVHLGAQGVWNVSQTVGLFIEPSVRLLKHGLSDKDSKSMDALMSVNLGMIYRFRGSEKYNSYRAAFERSEFLKSNRYFFELSGGSFMRFRRYHPALQLDFGFGKWFTPESGWRIHGGYSQIMHNMKYRSASGSIDYLLNLSTLAAGYNPDRIFNLDMFAGLTAGLAHYDGGKNSIIVGPEAGLRGRFRVSDHFALLLEPSISVLRLPNYNGRNFTLDAHLMAGVAYQLGREAKKTRTGETSSSSDVSSEDNFVSFSIGPNLYSETFFSGLKNKVSVSIDASVGHWFNTISGIQAGLGYDFMNIYRSKLSIGYIHADYMLSLTGLFRGERGRFFDLTVYGGPGIGWSSRSNGKFTPMGHLGVEARFRVWRQLDVTLSPNIGFWLPRMVPTIPNNHHFGGTAKLPVGVSYRF